MRRILVATLALSALAGSLAGAAGTSRRLSVQVENGRRVEVFRAIPVYRGLAHRVEISGPGVDRTTRVEAGPGLEIPPSRIGRSPDSLRVELRVDPASPLGPSDVRLRYQSEPTGPEVFPLVVLRNGRVTGVEPRRVSPGQRVVLTFTGTEIGNAEVLAHNAYTDARVLPGGTESRCQVELRFTKTGTFEVPLYDRAGLPKPGPTLDASGGYALEAAARVEVVTHP